MERAVGDKFKFKDVTLVVKVGEGCCNADCNGCYFLSNDECTVNDIETHNIIGECVGRHDNKLIIFKEVNMKPVYPFHRIASAKRKYSTTPIVRVTLDGNGKEQEDIVICVVLPKNEGNALSEKIVELLNGSNVQ
jgi:hypothetical protein